MTLKPRHSIEILPVGMQDIQASSDIATVTCMAILNINNSNIAPPSLHSIVKHIILQNKKLIRLSTV